MNITLLGKTLVKHYDHYLYRLDYGKMTPLENGRLNQFELTLDNLDSINASSDLRKMLASQPDNMYGLGFRDDDDNVVGHAFLMTRGGTEVLYKIRNIDAYIFALRVFNDFRGNRYSYDIMSSIIKEDRRRRNTDTFYLTVKKDNIPARKTYEKMGFSIVGERSFHRVPKLNLNIPYYTL